DVVVAGSGRDVEIFDVIERDKTGADLIVVEGSAVAIQRATNERTGDCDVDRGRRIVRDQRVGAEPAVDMVVAARDLDAVVSGTRRDPVVEIAGRRDDRVVAGAGAELVTAGVVAELFDAADEANAKERR